MNPKGNVPGLVVSPAVVKLVNIFCVLSACDERCLVEVDGGIDGLGALDPSPWAQVTHSYPPVQCLVTEPLPLPRALADPQASALSHSAARSHEGN